MPLQARTACSMLLGCPVKVMLPTLRLAAANDSFTFEWAIRGRNHRALTLAIPTIVVNNDPVRGFSQLVRTRRIGKQGGVMSLSADCM